MEQINWKTNISITNDKIKQSLANYLLSKKFKETESEDGTYYLYHIDSQYFADFSYIISITIQDIENSYSDILINFSYGETLKPKFCYDEIIINGQYLYSNINRIDNIIIDKIGKVLDCIDILEERYKELATLYNLDSDIESHQPWKIRGSNGKNYTNLQVAIDEVYEDDGGEVWIAKGTYKHGASMTMKNNVAIYGGFAGTETSKDQRVEGNETILDGEGKYRVFRNNYTEDNPLTNSAKLDNVTIQNGYTSNNGGGIYNYYASPEITNCTFSSNITSSIGGGISNSFSSPTLTNCTFANNSALRFGSGMSNFNFSSPTLTNCTFSNNSASYGGGGMYNTSSSPVLTNCTFSNNSAPERGGGMWNVSSSLEIINCTFVNNQAHNGGGIYGDMSNLKIINCTIFKNLGISKKDGYSIYHSVGVGIYSSYSKGLTIQNCILWDNYSSDDKYKSLFEKNPSVEFPTKLDNCIIQYNDDSEIGDYNDEIIHDDPLLQPLANNGGFVQTCAVVEGSSAIGAGEVVDGLTTDARGFTRSSTPTIGAYEYID